MVQNVTAVVDHGQLRLDKPLDLPNGRKVELTVHLVPTPEEEQREMDEFRAALQALHEAAAQCPPELLDEFQRTIQENRLDFPERFISQLQPEEQ